MEENNSATNPIKKSARQDNRSVWQFKCPDLMNIFSFYVFLMFLYDF